MHRNDESVLRKGLLLKCLPNFNSARYNLKRANDFHGKRDINTPSSGGGGE